jgi:hypothetical protein
VESIDIEFFLTRFLNEFIRVGATVHDSFLKKIALSAPSVFQKNIFQNNNAE